MENRQKTLDLLKEAIKSTRAGHDLEELELFEDGACDDYLNPLRGTDADIVRVTFTGGGHRYINVSMDSAWGVIIDVIKHIDI